MLSRRDVLASTAALSAGTLIAPSVLAYDKKNYGLQLYTVRAAMAQDAAGTLARIAKIGYNSVESSTYSGTQLFYGMQPAVFAGVLKQNGLAMPSSHYLLGETLDNGKPMPGTLLHDWDRAVDDAAVAGARYMVCWYLQEPERGNINHYKVVADRLNKAGERCKKAGLQLCYHNHDFEFAAQQGTVPYDVLLKQTDKNLVRMELDFYWAIKAGRDPVALIKSNPGRFPLWHLQDMDKTPKQDFTELGNGGIDFKKLFANATLAGLQYAFVEQERVPGSPFDSAGKSLAYLKANLM